MSRENTEPKRYHIDSFDKLCNVATSENVERLALDLMHWLVFYVHTIDKVRRDLPKETGKKTNTKIIKSHFTWVDDGKNDLLHATVENPITGEIQKVDFNKDENKTS